MSSQQSTIDSLQEKGWALVDSHQHPLGRLREKDLNSYKLVVLLGTKNRIGANYFQIFLQTGLGDVSYQPIIIGLHNQGRYPSYNWIEIVRISSRLSFTSGEQVLDISPEGLIRQLLQSLAELIPPGGHMMVDYDSPEHQDTARSLALGIPPVATPLGYILFLVGCGAGFKDWHFAEGGSEGPRKLQGYKALNEQHAQLRAEKTYQELTTFLSRLPPEGASELERAAHDRILVILDRLKHDDKSQSN